MDKLINVLEKKLMPIAKDWEHPKVCVNLQTDVR